MDCGELYQSIKDINLPIDRLTKETFTKSVQEFDPIYTGIVSLLSRELKLFNKLEEHINPIDDAEHIKSFTFEVSVFLKELSCPYSSLIEGPLESRLSAYEDRIKLLEYLISEVQASKIIAANTSHESSKRVALSESPMAQQIRCMLQALTFPKPPPNVTTNFLFTKVLQKLKEIIAVVGPPYLGQPLFTGQLTHNQWQELAQLAEEMGQEYRMRKELLLTRVDVTVESFTWSQRLKDKKGLIAEKYDPKRRCLDAKTDINVADLLSARDDLLKYEKTSDTNVRKNTQSSINKVLIGKVPDRGGRPSEAEPPPPEVPSWMKNDASHNSQGSRDFKSRGDGRGRSSFDGGKVQGGWDSNDRHNRPPQNDGTWYGATPGVQPNFPDGQQQFYYDNSSNASNYYMGRGNPIGQPGGNAQGFRNSDFGVYNDPHQKANFENDQSHSNHSRGGGRGRGYYQNNPHGRGGYHH